MFLACCRTVGVGGPDNVHATGGSRYTTTYQIVVLHTANVLVVHSAADTSRVVGEVQRNGGTALVFDPLLGNGVLLESDELVSDDARAATCRQPLCLHTLQFAGNKRTMLCGKCAS